MKIGLIALALGFLAGLPQSSAKAASLVDGTAEAGQSRAVTCGACHGTDGNSVNPTWPSIASQHATYIYRQLQAFKGDPNGENKTRFDPVMSTQVIALSDQDMRDLAVYFESQDAAARPVADPDTVDSGERLYRGGDDEKGVPACMACHGPNGRGNPAAAYPSIRGQYAIYTAKQLRDYASGARKSDGPTKVMRDIAQRLSETEIAEVSSYIQGLH
jgi:cytochrome c553